MCPMCDRKLIYKPSKSISTSNEEATHIYKCPECPFIGFEYYEDRNILDLSNHLGFSANYVDHSDMCELAHKLTERECKIKKIEFEYSPRGEVQYTNEAQEIFDFYYVLIENTLNI